MADIIKTKTEKNEFVDNPDCPHLEEARMYLCYDTTAWDNLQELEQSQGITGKMTGVSAKAYVVAHLASRKRGCGRTTSDRMFQRRL